MQYRFLRSSVSPQGWAVAWFAAFALLFVTGCGDDADNGTGGTAATGGAGGSGATGGSGGTGGTGGSGGNGSATLTIGEETWDFDAFDCAFGTDATGSPLFSFSSNAFGEDAGGARIQMQADIEDDTGQGRYEGDGVVYTVYITDIDDFASPSVDWESRSRGFVGRPSQDTMVVVDGDRVTAEGLFDDLTTPAVVEEVPGSLDALCGSQSIGNR